jgi:hypothetical protein
VLVPRDLLRHARRLVRVQAAPGGIMTVLCGGCGAELIPDEFTEHDHGEPLLPHYCSSCLSSIEHNEPLPNEQPMQSNIVPFPDPLAHAEHDVTNEWNTDFWVWERPR